MDSLEIRQCFEKTLPRSIVSNGSRTGIGTSQHPDNHFPPWGETALSQQRRQMSVPAVSCTRQAFVASREAPAKKAGGQFHHCGDRENAEKRPVPEWFSNTVGIPGGVPTRNKQSVWPEYGMRRDRYDLLRMRARPISLARSLASYARARRTPLLTRGTNVGRRKAFHPSGPACRKNIAELTREPLRPPENAPLSMLAGIRIFVRKHSAVGHHRQQTGRGLSMRV